MDSFGGAVGVERDATGLLFMRNRYYNCELGRFITRDPIGINARGANFYAYCKNDPYQIDPLGLYCWPEHNGQQYCSEGGRIWRNKVSHESLPASHRVSRPDDYSPQPTHRSDDVGTDSFENLKNWSNNVEHGFEDALDSGLDFIMDHLPKPDPNDLEEAERIQKRNRSKLKRLIKSICSQFEVN